MTTTLTRLKEARELLVKPGTWTQHALYRDASGDRTSKREEACQYCLLGSVWPDVVAGYELCRTLDAERYGIMTVTHWNDAPGRTVDQVLEVIDKTIARLETPKTETVPIEK